MNSSSVVVMGMCWWLLAPVGCGSVPGNVTDSGVDTASVITPDAADAGDVPTVLPDASDDPVAPDRGQAGCPADPSGIVSWWHGDDALTDPVGSNPGMPPDGGTTGFSPGVLGSGFRFTGAAGSFVEVRDAATLRIMEAITIDAWVSPTTPTGRILDKFALLGDGGAASMGYFLDLTTSQVRMGVGADSLLSGTILPTAAFTHVAGVFRAGNLTLYVNGVRATTKTSTVTAIPTSTTPLHLGADSLGGTRFTGVVDEPRIFNRALSGSEIQTIYQAGSIAHCGCVPPPAGLVSWWAGESNFGDVRAANAGMDGGTVTFATGAVGSGFSLTGAANSFINVASSDSLNVGASALTIEAWINAGAAAGRIVDKSTTAMTDGYTLELMGGLLRFAVGTDAIVTTAAVAQGRFVHVVGVYDRTNLSLYVDGARVANRAAIVTVVPTNTRALRIGADSAGATRFTGIIDEPRIYNVGLSPDEIQAIYRAGAANRCK